MNHEYVFFGAGCHKGSGFFRYFGGSGTCNAGDDELAAAFYCIAKFVKFGPGKGAQMRGRKDFVPC